MIEQYFQRGMDFLEEGKTDAAWCSFYKALQQLEYHDTFEKDLYFHKLRFMILCEIGKIQQNKYHHDAAKSTFEKAETIRKTFLMELGIEPLKQVGLLKWEDDFETMKTLEADEQYYALVNMGELLIDELESLDYSAKDRAHWRLLLQCYEMMNRAYDAIQEPEKAEAYDEKAEDLAFLQDFDRFSSFD